MKYTNLDNNLQSRNDFDQENHNKIENISKNGENQHNIIKEDISKRTINQSEETKRNPKELIKEFIGNVSEDTNNIIDNEFILVGYRINFHTFKTITKSACMCHNETVNICTHFIGFILVVIFAFMIMLNIGPINPDNFITKNDKSLNKNNNFIIKNENENENKINAIYWKFMSQFYAPVIDDAFI